MTDPVLPATLHEALPLLEVVNPQELDLLLADARTAAFIVKRLSPHCVVVDPRYVDDLLARLRRLGHTPKVEG